MVQMVSAEAMSAAASHLSRNWGDYGYRLGVELAGYGPAVFLARASDGSEFRFLVHRYGVVEDLPEARTLGEALELREAQREVPDRAADGWGEGPLSDYPQHLR